MATDSDFGFVGDSFNLSNLRILASIDQANTLDIVARKDSGIKTPSDLIGKKIGVPLKLAPEFFFNQFLISNNILPNQVKIIDTSVANEQDAIVSGKVDAVSAPNPTAYNIANALGTNSISWPAQGNQDFSWFVISNDQFIKNNPEAVQRFLASLLTAENFTKTNPEESKQIIEKKFTFEKKYFDQIWPRHQFSLTLYQSSMITMEDEARWVIANKLTTQTVIPDYLNFIDFDALTKIKPESVTVIY
jgi:NitT/TauT family transport system substrate-binding protein